VTPDATFRRRAVFLDRDGVINEERAFVHRIEDFIFVPGSVDALRRFKEAGYLLVVITNQSGIARGHYSEADYGTLTRHMQEQLAASGVQLDAVEFCPHLPEAPILRYRLECDCRKPRPGMIVRAINALNIDACASILIGDRASDIEAGRRAGVGHCFLVRSGYPLAEPDIDAADGVYEDLRVCAEQVAVAGR
jgi:D-glycero-D-manno-heptose 1,7-bisphosphate phosphatase